MIEIIRKADCCGCRACEQSCPKKCISMQVDEEGFTYPKVDLNKCISCNKCEKVCPIKNKKFKNEYALKTYVAHSLKDELFDNSSSGAIFAELAIGILNQNGAVFGAAFDADMNVRHICIEDERNLYLLQGSKYVQSDIKDSYIRALKKLRQGQKVLFSGTPCQIAGLRSFLDRDYENLFTVDILCHGTPSPLVLRRYLEEISSNNENKAIEKVSFRIRKPDAACFYFGVKFDDGTSFTEPVPNNLYMNLFIRNFSLRPSCFACRFKSIDKKSDITIGDCWDRSITEMNDGRPLSLVMLHSMRGEGLFTSISDNIKMHISDIDYLIPPGDEGRRAVRKNFKRYIFFKKLSKTDHISEMSNFVKPSWVRKVYWKIKK